RTRARRERGAGRAVPRRQDGLARLLRRPGDEGDERRRRPARRERAGTRQARRVKIVRFDPSRPIAQHGSSGAAVAGIARVDGPAQVVYIRLDAGGVLGEHPAATAQLFLVVTGSGWVRAGADRRDVAAGSGAFWEPNELHESGTDDGLTAIVVEAESIELV